MEEGVIDEQLEIRLRRADADWPVAALVKGSRVRLEGEADKWPRLFRLHLQPDNAAARESMRQIRQVRGWSGDAFEVATHVENGALVFSGVDAESWPIGYFRVRLDVADLDTGRGFATVEIERNGRVTVPLDCRENPRSVRVRLAQADPEVLRILRATQVEGRPALGWLEDDQVDPQRRACVMNILAKLRTAPSPSNPLLHAVERIFWAELDRIYAVVRPSVLESLTTLAGASEQVFIRETTPLHPCHQLLLEAVDTTLNEPTEGYELASFRQEGWACLQIVVAHPKEGTIGTHYADIDIDLGNPLQDVAGVLVHGLEVASGKTTDHLELHRWLEHQPAGAFLIYDVEPARG